MPPSFSTLQKLAGSISLSQHSKLLIFSLLAYLIISVSDSVILGRGTQRIDPKTGKQKIFRANELKQNSRSGSSTWDGSIEWDVPGTNHRILQKPDGSLGYVLNHDYSKLRLCQGPWYPEGVLK